MNTIIVTRDTDTKGDGFYFDLCHNEVITPICFLKATATPELVNVCRALTIMYGNNIVFTI